MTLERKRKRVGDFYWMIENLRRLQEILACVWEIVKTLNEMKIVETEAFKNQLTGLNDHDYQEISEVLQNWKWQFNILEKKMNENSKQTE